MKVLRNRRHVCYRRDNQGSAITEFGPALGILLICFFFPLLNMLVLGVAYCLCMVLNYNQVHEASLLPMADATSVNGPVCKEITDKWLAGMGKFVKTDGYTQTVVSYRDGHSEGNVTDRIAVVQTLVVCQPLLNIPLPGVNVPGLNGPMVFSVSSESTMENPDNAPIAMNGQNSQSQNAKMSSSGKGAAAGGAQTDAQANAASKPLSGGGWDGNNLRISVHRCRLLGSRG